MNVMTSYTILVIATVNILTLQKKRRKNRNVCILAIIAWAIAMINCIVVILWRGDYKSMEIFAALLACVVFLPDKLSERAGMIISLGFFISFIIAYSFIIPPLP